MPGTVTTALLPVGRPDPPLPLSHSLNRIYAKPSHTGNGAYTPTRGGSDRLHQ